MAGLAALLRSNRVYRRLWIAEVVSFLGDWFNTIALYTIVFELSGSARAVAGVMVCKTLPIFLVSPLAGPLVDRWDRRRVLIAADVGRALLAGGLILSYHAGSLPALYACITLMVGLTGFFFPARNSALPQIVSPGELASANALSGGTWSVMLAVGAALGGWVTALVGIDAALALDGLTFLVSAAFLLGIPALPASRDKDARHDTSFVGGLRYLAANRYALALAALKPLMALSGGAIVLLPLFGTTVFPGRQGPFWVGILYSVRGLGAFIGSVVFLKIFGGRSRALRRVVLGAFALTGVSYVVLGRAPRFEIAAAAVLVAAIGTGCVWVVSGYLLQREGDRRYLGRIFSMEFGVTTLLFALTGWIVGVALDAGRATAGELARLSGWVMLVPILVWGGVVVAVERRARESTERPGREGPSKAGPE